MKIRDFDSAVAAARTAQQARLETALDLGKAPSGDFQVYGERHDKWDFALPSTNNYAPPVSLAAPSSEILVDGTIDDPDLVDVYGINLVAGQTYMFSAYGSGGDPLGDSFLYVLDGGFNILNYDDDGGSSVNSLITYTATFTGTHFIGVGSYPGSGLTGDYTLDAIGYTGVDLVGDTFAGAPSLSMNTVTYGWIDAGPDGPYGPGFSEVDTFSITVEAGNIYSIELAGGADYESDFLNLPDGELDTVIVIYDSAGNVVFDNDDISFPSDISSRIDFFATEDAVYYVDVFSYSPNTSGGYSITTRELNPADYDPLDSIIWASANNVPFVNGVAYVYFGHAGETFGQTADDGVTPMTTFGWNAYEIQAVMKALEQYEKILGVDYQITGSLSEATFRLSTTSSDLYGAYFAPQDPAYGPDQGVGVFNVDSGGWNFDVQQSLVQGGYAFEVILHEFGHAHGLAHPHDRGGGSDIMLGVTASQGSYGLYDLNQGVYTVMSYNSSWATGPNGESPFTAAGVDNGWSGTLSAFDIAALQQRYGVINPHATGNTTYTLDDVQDQGTYYECIWDTGGKDTIKYDGAKNTRIDLLAATLDYSPTGGGVMSFVDGILGGFTIAAGVVIENASGGSGDDSILGNAANNELKGGAGNDVLVGREGGDKLDGGTGTDVASYLTSSAGVTASLDNNGCSTGDAAGDKFSGIEGLQGSNFNDKLGGDKKGNTITGEGGDDYLDGGDGNDTLEGGDGNDKLDGGKGVDTLDGGAGDDKLYGDKDNDTLIGGTGNDTMEGGAGKDTFVFSLGDGNDKIKDFEKKDLIDFRGIDVAWDELDSNGNNKLDHNDAFVNVTGGNMVIDYGAAAGGVAGSDTITLCDTSSLKEDSFLFG
jgi:serralysin